MFSKQNTNVLTELLMKKELVLFGKVPEDSFWFVCLVFVENNLKRIPDTAVSATLIACFILQRPSNLSQGSRTLYF